MAGAAFKKHPEWAMLTNRCPLEGAVGFEYWQVTSETRHNEVDASACCRIARGSACFSPWWRAANHLVVSVVNLAIFPAWHSNKNVA
jgi:hypothetical protein